jgi:hypothetical protein
MKGLVGHVKHWFGHANNQQATQVTVNFPKKGTYYTCI